MAADDEVGADLKAEVSNRRLERRVLDPCKIGA